MTQPTGTVAQPPPGPQHPLPVSPVRHPHSVRRTTSIDVTMPALPGGTVPTQPGGAVSAVPGGVIVAEVAGQDLRTAADGSAEVVDRLAVRLLVDPVTGVIEAVEGDTADVVRALVGVGVRGGYSRHLVDAFPDEAAARPLWYSAFEDLPGAFLVAGYSLLRAGFLKEPNAARDRAAHQADICVGWATGGPVHDALADHGVTLVPFGPDAPALEAGDPAGWHAVGAVPAGAVRRRRQLDVRPGAEPGTVTVQSHFRDSYGSDEPEMVMHEYVVDAGIDAGGHIASVRVDARVLPWEACPRAVASATAVEGVRLADLGATIRAELTGVATCTHLNSTLRALTDVPALTARLDDVLSA